MQLLQGFRVVLFPLSRYLLQESHFPEAFEVPGSLQSMSSLQAVFMFLQSRLPQLLPPPILRLMHLSQAFRFRLAATRNAVVRRHQSKATHQPAIQQSLPSDYRPPLAAPPH